MIWLAGVAAFLLFMALLARGFAQASAAQVKRGALWLLAALLLGGMAALLLTGRAPQALGLLVPLLPVLWPALRRWRARRRFGAPPGEEHVSTVRTALLAMRLDHASGAWSGRVLAGRFEGRELGEMNRAEWLELLAECHATDAESVPLLEGWLDRAAPGWREEDSASPDGGMTRAAALALLGLAEGAVPAEIRAAHRRLMRAAHPDRGGDAALAARLNQARDLLLDGTAH